MGATVTGIVKDVQLLSGQTIMRSASMNETVINGTTVLTGSDSRAELTFNDQTVARLAASTIFNFKNGTQELNLSDGAVLLQVPKSAKRAKIQATGVAAAIAGTTGVFEYHPGVYKFLVLEGTARLYRPHHLGDSILIRPGQLVIGNPKETLAQPVDFDIGRFVKTSRFIIDFPPLRSEQLLARESQKQQRQKSKKTLIDTNLVIFGSGTVVSLVAPSQMRTITLPPAAPSTPLSTASSGSADLGTIETFSQPQATEPSTPTTQPNSIQKDPV